MVVMREGLLGLVRGGIRLTKGRMELLLLLLMLVLLVLLKEIERR